MKHIKYIFCGAIGLVIGVCFIELFRSFFIAFPFVLLGIWAILACWIIGFIFGE